MECSRARARIRGLHRAPLLPHARDALQREAGVRPCAAPAAGPAALGQARRGRTGLGRRLHQLRRLQAGERALQRWVLRGVLLGFQCGRLTLVQAPQQRPCVRRGLVANWLGFVLQAFRCARAAGQPRSISEAAPAQLRNTWHSLPAKGSLRWPAWQLVCRGGVGNRHYLRLVAVWCLRMPCQSVMGTIKYITASSCLRPCGPGC